MLRNVLCAAVILMLWGCVSAGTGRQDSAVTDVSTARSLEGIHWHSLAEGSKLAREQKKPMVVDFFVSEGCPRCARMIKEVYSDEKVIEIMNSDFIPVRIDLGGELTEEERQLGEAHDYSHECLLLFLDSSGKVIEQPGGKKLCFADYVGADFFVEYLKYVKKTQ